MSEDKLLPCPFCGTDDPVLGEDVNVGAWSVTCAHCGVEVGNYAGYRSAVRVWNRRAALSSRAPLVPEGWKLVPIYPTGEMLIAVRKQTVRDMFGEHMGPSAENNWRAMLGATPAVPEQTSTGHTAGASSLQDEATKQRSAGASGK